MDLRLWTGVEPDRTELVNTRPLPIESKIKENILTEHLALPTSGIYQWRDTPGFSFIGDADEIVAHLEGLAEKKGGSVSTDDLVADAMDESSPLHPNIEHDERVAAHNWRKHQMRNLIGALVRVTVVESQNEEKREIRVKAFPHTGEGYTPVQIVLTDTELRDRYVGQLSNEIKAWAKKARDFREFVGIVNAIQSLPEDTSDGNGKNSDN